MSVKAQTPLASISCEFVAQRVVQQAVQQVNNRSKVCVRATSCTANTPGTKHYRPTTDPQHLDVSECSRPYSLLNDLLSNKTLQQVEVV